MARSGSVLLLLLLPLLLLLLPPLLLASDVAYEFENLANVTWATKYWGAADITKTETACADLCGGDEYCSGYVFEAGECQRYGSTDCRVPDVGGPPAPAGYMARNTCPGTASDPCGCPDGFHRYGSLCLTLLDQPVTWPEAVTKCSELVAHLAMPRTKDDQKQVALAAVQLQKAPFANVWLDIYHDGYGWSSWDGCWDITQYFWARGQPEHTDSLSYVVYSPPSASRGQPGWRTVLRDNTEQYLPLCQLRYCYRPDC